MLCISTKGAEIMFYENIYYCPKKQYKEEY